MEKNALAEQKQTALKQCSDVNKYLDVDVVELFTEDGKRYVHFCGYGYFADSSDGNPEHCYRYLEYVFNTIPLELFVNDTEDRTSDDYNAEFNNDHHTYIEDCDEARIIEIYESGYSNEPLKHITRETADSLPDGFYLWVS